MKKQHVFILFLLTFISIAFFSLNRNPLTVVSRDGLSMNTPIRISVAGQDEKRLKEALDDAFTLLDKLNNQMSLYREDSILSAINQEAGVRPVAAGPDVFAAIREAAEVARLTEAAFNPLVGPLTRLWKINQLSKTEYALPSQASIDAALPLSNIDNLTLISPDAVSLKQKGCVLDLGGIAKGYASWRIAQLFTERGISSALIDLGGNIYALGSQPKGGPWNIGIRNPADPTSGPIAVLETKDASVITSGSYERYRIIDGKRYSHLFDPSTGYPVDNEMQSATIVSPNAALADALATAFMVMGPKRAADFMEKQMKKDPTFGAVLILKDPRQESGAAEHLSLIATSNLKDRLKVLLPDTPIRYLP